MAPRYGQDEVWIPQPGIQCAYSLASAYFANLTFCSSLQLIQEPSASEYAMFFLTHRTLYIIFLVSSLCWVLSPNHASDIWSDIISAENTPQIPLGFPSMCHHHSVFTAFYLPLKICFHPWTRKNKDSCGQGPANYSLLYPHYLDQMSGIQYFKINY